MSAHLRKRNRTYYLIDGRLALSLRTTKRSLAMLQLEKYQMKALKICALPTIEEYYIAWYERKATTANVALLQAYRGAFSKYVLPYFGRQSLDAVTVASLEIFRGRISGRLSPKSVRNIIDGSFRSMWRSAMKDGLVTSNPFALIEWPRLSQNPPDPFSATERDTIIAYFFMRDVFYYPYVFFQFHTGLRPSETAALRWAQVDLERDMLTVAASRTNGKENATKTRGSHRTIELSEAVRMVLSTLPSRVMNLSHVFVNKHGRPLTKKWAEHNWRSTLVMLGIRHRKFYSTRHTFITEAIRSGDSPLAVAQYCGTSVTMIQRDYCGTQRLGILDATKLRHPVENPLQNVVAGPGFEPGRLLPIVRELRRSPVKNE